MDFLIFIAIIIIVVVKLASASQHKPGTGKKPSMYRNAQAGQPDRTYRYPQQGSQSQGAYQHPQQGGQSQGTYQRSQQGGQPQGTYQHPQQGSHTQGAYQRSQQGGQTQGAYQRPQQGGQSPAAYHKPQQKAAQQSGGMTAEAARRGQSARALQRDVQNIRSEEEAQQSMTVEAPDELMRQVEELIVMGYQAKLPYERDFVAEGMDMLNRI